MCTRANVGFPIGRGKSMHAAANRYRARFAPLICDPCLQIRTGDTSTIHIMLRIRGQSEFMVSNCRRSILLYGFVARISFKCTNAG